GWQGRRLAAGNLHVVRFALLHAIGVKQLHEVAATPPNVYGGPSGAIQRDRGAVVGAQGLLAEYVLGRGRARLAEGQVAAGQKLPGLAVEGVKLGVKSERCGHPWLLLGVLNSRPASCGLGAFMAEKLEHVNLRPHVVDVSDLYDKLRRDQAGDGTALGIKAF